MNKLLPRFLFLAACVAVLTFVSGCASAKSGTTIDESRYAEPIRLACVGDSITYGATIKDRKKDSYPAQLAVLLGAKWEVRNFGRSGATLLSQGNLPYVKQPEYRKALDFKPQVIVIKLGTNDSKQMTWDTHKSEFVADYEALLASFSSLETKPVIYLCRPIPVYAPDVWGIREPVLVDEIAPKIVAIAKAHGLTIIDLYTPFVGKGDLVPDKIHPNAQGAGLLARTVYTALTGRVPATP